MSLMLLFWKRQKIVSGRIGFKRESRAGSWLIIVPYALKTYTGGLGWKRGQARQAGVHSPATGLADAGDLRC